MKTSSYMVFYREQGKDFLSYQLIELDGDILGVDIRRNIQRRLPTNSNVESITVANSKYGYNPFDLVHVWIDPKLPKIQNNTILMLADKDRPRYKTMMIHPSLFPSGTNVPEIRIDVDVSKREYSLISTIRSSYRNLDLDYLGVGIVSTIWVSKYNLRNR